jgi:UDP-N-acetyl-D-galactosamine dehydrogenase
MHEDRIAVIGLGYVGLPVAVGVARAHGRVVGFDIKHERVDALRRGEDATREFTPEELKDLPLHCTTDPADLAGTSFFIVTVPTPIDADRRPDLSALRAASRTVGRHLAPGAIVVYESTVYPGLTEEVCGPILAEASGLRCGVDF